MDFRRRLVAALAVAATAASLALVVTAPALAETRTTRLISTTTAAGQDAFFEGGGGDSVYYSDSTGLYRNVGGAVSTVISGYVDVERVSTDGTRLLVETDRTLSQSDTDGGPFDVYLLDTSTVPAGVTLVSTAGTASSVQFQAASPDLSRVVYQSSAGTYVVANGAAPRLLGGAGSTFSAASSDVSAVAYGYAGSQHRDISGQTTALGTSSVKALSDDGVTGYTLGSGVLRRFSAPASQASVAPTVIATGVSTVSTSPDGQSAFVTTADSLSSSDTDTSDDVYRFDVGGASPVLMTAGAATTNVAARAVTPGRGLVFNDGTRLLRTDAAGVASDLGAGLSGQPVFRAVMTTGAVVFDTLVGDANVGVYATDVAGNRTQIVPVGEYEGSSPDGTKIWYRTFNPFRIYESAVPQPVTPPSPPADTTAPAASAKAKKRQENDGRIEVQVTCTGTEVCRVTGAGTLSVTVPATRGKRKFALTAPLTLLSPGQKAVVSFKVRKKAKKAAALAVRRGGRAQAVLRIAVADTSGNTRALPVKVRLR